MTKKEKTTSTRNIERPWMSIVILDTENAAEVLSKAGEKSQLLNRQWREEQQCYTPPTDRDWKSMTLKPHLTGDNQ